MLIFIKKILKKIPPTCIQFATAHIYKTGWHQMEDLSKERNYIPIMPQKEQDQRPSI